MSTGEDGGIRILSFDNGGARAYSQLLLLREYMSRIASDSGIDEFDVYPVDYFDLMGGVGFGALVAILLGGLSMRVDDAIDGLISVASAVFPSETQEVVDRETKLDNLKCAIEDLLQAKGIPPNMKMHDKSQPAAKCKCYPRS